MAFYFCLEGGEMDVQFDLQVFTDPKMLRETLCLAQSLFMRNDRASARDHGIRLQYLITEIDRHRPLSSNGKHGNLHTETCGCEDK